MQIQLDRRNVLVAAGAGATAAALGRWAPAAGDSPVFLHGVASGDPLARRVVIWTRVTPTPDAVPGSGLGPEVEVAWEVARDPGFQTIVAQGALSTGPDRDHTVKVDVGGLRPRTRYWYRFLALGETSPVGRTRTAAAPGAPVSSVRLGVVSCAHYEWGLFGAYRLLAEQDLDAVLHLGDYIYEYAPDGAVPIVDSPVPRDHEPAHECVTLADYRERHGQYKRDADLRALHAAHPMIPIWDDHEVANDAWREGAENHQPDEGDFAARAAAGRQAWREWQPVRTFTAQSTRINRELRFGDLVHLWMLDERQFRDVQPDSALLGYGSIDPAAKDPSRTMLGQTQRQWLVDGLTASPAAWKVLGNQVPFFPLSVGPALPAAIETLLSPVLDQLPAAVPPALYVDDWNGYVAERRALLSTIAGVPDVVILTGDVHETFASDLPKDPGTYLLTRRSVGVEFIVPAVSSPSLARGANEVAAPVGNLVDAAFETNLALGNPWVRYHDGFANGFGVVDFTAERVQCEFWHLADATDPATAGRVATSWQSRRGANRLTRATQPLGPRT